MSFEVERFEWTAGDRLELAGRWFDVRGRRFLRPTLDVEVDGRSRRLLATLEHKPWAADEGEEWLAAFAWDGEAADIDAAQLTVGPDLAVDLAPPATAAGVQPRRSKSVGRELAAARAEVKRLRAERERDATRARLESVESELVAAARARDKAREERNSWLSRARDAASERDSALASRQTAVTERDSALAQRNAAFADRDAALAERDAAAAERKAARADREASRRELEAARRE